MINISNFLPKTKLKKTIAALVMLALLIGVIVCTVGIPISKNKEDNSSISFRFPLISFVENIWRYRQISSSIKTPTFPNNTCNIEDYGAISDGNTLNTEAINKAIADCSQKGGGTVNVSKGEFVTGPIRLASHINFHLEPGSALRFTDDRNQYLPPIFTRFQGMELYNFSPLIYGKDLTDVAITGEGKLVGNGEEWIEWSTSGDEDSGWEKLIQMAKDGDPVKQRVFGEEDRLRPSFIQLINTKNILIEGILIEDSPFWTVHPIYSENIMIRNIRINSRGINTDGIVVDSSRNVLIENSEIISGDDAIAIKSGLENDGWRVGKPSENIIIRNMNVLEGHAGVAFGSEMSGDVRNVIVRDSIFKNTDTGINMKSLPGRGGTIENIWLYHVTFAPVQIGIKINMQYETEVRSGKKHLPTFKNILISRVRIATSDNAVYIQGLEENDQMRNIDIVDLRANIKENSLKETRTIGSFFSTL